MKEENNYEVSTKFNKDLIVQETGFSGSDQILGMARNVIQLQEQGVREALIKLGWTPPESLADIRAEAVIEAANAVVRHNECGFCLHCLLIDHANKIKGAE